jgi:hypothetical protein
MNKMRKTLLIALVSLSTSNYFNAQVFPVYFADVSENDGKEILHFEWRPDYSFYDKAIITDNSDKLIGELKYPENHFRINESSASKVLFVTALGKNGEKSAPARVELDKDYSSLYASGPAEQIIIEQHSGENARFVGTQSGREFIALGVNYCGIRLADHDSFEPDIIANQAHVDRVGHVNSNPATSLVHPVKVGDRIQFYDPYRTETIMRTLKAHGYNLVRVFVKPGERGSEITNIKGLSGPAETKGLSAAYMDNFVDFLKCAQKYGIYVMPCFTENEMPDNDYFKALSKGASKQEILFSEDGIRAKQHYMELFLQYIKKQNPELNNSLFALSMQNEFAFHSDEAPFNQQSGYYTFIDGSTYDMADDEQRRVLANAAIQNYYAKMKEAVAANAPGLLLGEGTFSMGAVGKTYENSKGIRTIVGNKDLRFPMTAIELLKTDMDFLDFHVYRWGAKGTGKDVFMHFAENMKLLTPEAIELMKNKPIMMGEFGSFNFDETTLNEAIEFVKELNNAALDFGFKGSAYWTMDTFVQTNLWNLMWGDGKMLKAISNK